MDTDTENVSNKSQAAIEDYLSCFQTFLLTADKYGCSSIEGRSDQRSQGLAFSHAIVMQARL